jgi:hypothetical protein
MAISMWLSRPSVTSTPSRYCLATSRTAVVHRLVVVRGGDDQVGADHLVVFVDAVVVDQVPRGASMTPTPRSWRTPVAHQIVADDVVVVQQVLDGFGGVQHFDHARPVVAQGAPAALPPSKARNSSRSLSASGVGMWSHIVTRDSGPTRYQPSSVPSDLKNGNFM